LTETQASRTNFTTEQKVDFIMKVSGQQVPSGSVVTSLFLCYRATQHCNKS